MRQHEQLAIPAYRLMAMVTLVAGMLTGGILPSTGAQAAAFDVSDVAPHGDWQAATLSRETAGTPERHFRAVETTRYSDATLSVNATPGVCDLPWLEMRVALDDVPANAASASVVPARLRVDDKTLRPAVVEFFTERRNSGFYVHFYLNDLAGLLDNMRRGQQLFIGFDRGEREPWYMIFSLDGAGAAIDEALARCRRAPAT